MPCLAGDFKKLIHNFPGSQDKNPFRFKYPSSSCPKIAHAMQCRVNNTDNNRLLGLDTLGIYTVFEFWNLNVKLFLKQAPGKPKIVLDYIFIML